MSVSIVRRRGISGSQIFAWRRLMAQDALTAPVLTTRQYRRSKTALEAQVRSYSGCRERRPWKNERLREAKNERLREAVSRAAGPKKCCCTRPRCPRDALSARSPTNSASADSTCPSCATGHPHGGETAAAAGCRTGRRHPRARRRAARLAGPLQRRASTPRPGISITPRVHRGNPRGPVTPLASNNIGPSNAAIVSLHSLTKRTGRMRIRSTPTREVYATKTPL